MSHLKRDLPIIKKVGVDLKINLMESRALPALDQLLKDEKILFFSKSLIYIFFPEQDTVTFCLRNLFGVLIAERK